MIFIRIGRIVVRQAISTLMKCQANCILRHERFDRSLAFTPASFDVPSKEAFDEAQMNALYKVGCDLARAGYNWKKKPADFLAPGQR